LTRDARLVTTAAVRVHACLSAALLDGAGWQYALHALAVLILLVAGCTSVRPRATPPDPNDEPCELGGSVHGGEVEPGARDLVVAVKKKAWEASRGGEEAAKPYIRARLAGWPSRLVADRHSLPSGDRDFVARVARDTWRGIEAFTDRESHLPVDNVHLETVAADRSGGRVGDYTNITSVGLHLIAIVAAHDLKLVSTRRAVGEIRAVLATLDHLETYEGFFYNYYDTTSLERTSNFISFVDTSWLTAGLMLARGAFPDVGADATRLIDRQDDRFFYDAASGRMSHGYYVQLRARSRYHYGVLYAESRLGSVLAIGRGEAPEQHWFRMVRTFPADCAWQSMPPLDRRRKEIAGQPFYGGYYEWQGVRYVPSWGGSMFEALMPTLVLDEPAIAPRSLGANDAAHALVQRRYALELLADPVWGMSPSTRPDDRAYSEYGIKLLGSLGYAPGAVTPHASALALAVDPPAAIANLRTLAERYDAYGDFGFYDAVDPSTGEVAHAYLALDQAMVFIAAANYLTDHAIQRRFASDPSVARALPVLAREDFFN